jgi:hypothetical protein
VRPFVFKACSAIVQLAKSAQTKRAEKIAPVLAETNRKPNSARNHIRRVKQLPSNQRPTPVNEETKMAKKVKKVAKKAKKTMARKTTKKAARKPARKAAKRKTAKRKTRKAAAR